MAHQSNSHPTVGIRNEDASLIKPNNMINSGREWEWMDEDYEDYTIRRLITEISNNI
jgi:hypothetical protein